MIIASTAKEFLCSAMGISYVREDDVSLANRVNQARGYFERRFQMAKEAAFEYRSLETFRFYEDTYTDLKNFDPGTIRRRKWLEISGSKFPLPSQR